MGSNYVSRTAPCRLCSKELELLGWSEGIYQYLCWRCAVDHGGHSTEPTDGANPGELVRFIRDNINRLTRGRQRHAVVRDVYKKGRCIR